MITDNNNNTLADAEYVNGQARFTCHQGTAIGGVVSRSCPTTIKVKPNFISNKTIRLIIHKINS